MGRQDLPLEVVEQAPREVRTNVDAVVVDGIQQGSRRSLEVVNAIEVFQSFLNWHVVLSFDGESVFCHTIERSSGQADSGVPENRTH